ncbi:MAG TPA: hypothetical protein PLF28_03925 [Agitococcus sp.]|nr:hypothetical protein [Agitococcus sp.]HMX98882.1 hypothetical protein [Agitococcus sp.]HNC02385.1 hypothetical protein [Agitococcus sp.]HNI62595.1 hypothetical protein [Agitococcus sp.]HNL35650.1 hypothetical protein [Agitococcus sp.]
MSVRFETIQALIVTIVNEPENTLARQTLHQAMLDANFYLAAYGIPLEMKQALDQKPLIISQQLTKIPLQTATKGNSKALIAYNDLVTLQKNAPNHWQLEMTGRDLLNLLLISPNFDAIVLNSAQGWVGITQEEAKALVQTTA